MLQGLGSLGPLPQPITTARAMAATMALNVIVTP
jgi:hypothetical protein